MEPLVAFTLTAISAIFGAVKSNFEDFSVNLVAGAAYDGLKCLGTQRAMQFSDGRLPRNHRIENAARLALTGALNHFFASAGQKIGAKPIRKGRGLLKFLDFPTSSLQGLLAGHLPHAAWLRALVDSKNPQDELIGQALEGILRTSDALSLLEPISPREFDDRLNKGFHAWVEKTADTPSPEWWADWCAKGWPQENNGEFRIHFALAFRCFFRELIATDRELFQSVTAAHQAEQRAFIINFAKWQRLLRLESRQHFRAIAIASKDLGSIRQRLEEIHEDIGEKIATLAEAVQRLHVTVESNGLHLRQAIRARELPFSHLENAAAFMSLYLQVRTLIRADCSDHDPFLIADKADTALAKLLHCEPSDLFKIVTEATRTVQSVAAIDVRDQIHCDLVRHRFIPAESRILDALEENRRQQFKIEKEQVQVRHQQAALLFDLLQAREGAGKYAEALETARELLPWSNLLDEQERLRFHLLHLVLTTFAGNPVEAAEALQAWGGGRIKRDRGSIGLVLAIAKRAWDEGQRRLAWTSPRPLVEAAANLEAQICPDCSLGVACAWKWGVRFHLAKARLALQQGNDPEFRAHILHAQEFHHRIASMLASLRAEQTWYFCQYLPMLAEIHALCFQRAELVKVLKDIESLAGRFDPATAVWARRCLAQVLNQHNPEHLPFLHEGIDPP